MGKLAFASDYMEGAHENIIRRLVETNGCHTVGYGFDEFTGSARERIRAACGCPGAEVELLVGGTQTNAVVITSLLKSYEGVLAADSGHISVHEAGAIECGGHKVLTLASVDGKISAGQVEKYLNDFFADDNHEHMVNPGMVYISQPTEYGTLYTKEELAGLSDICRKNGIPLYVDGARLAYALAAEENDVTLPDLAKLCDIFYIGGTKCGALFGEAVVVPDPKLIPHFFTMIKQHGALLAKGRLLGIQFDELFRDRLYERIGGNAIRYANAIRAALEECGYTLVTKNPTNQVFCVIPDEKLAALSGQVDYGFWEKYDEAHTVVRFATSWATDEKDVQELIHVLEVLSRASGKSE